MRVLARFALAVLLAAAGGCPGAAPHSPPPPPPPPQAAPAPPPDQAKPAPSAPPEVEVPRPRPKDGAPAPDGTHARPGQPEAGRAFLVGSESEARGYALYSYLLLGALPDDTTRDRYRAAVLAYLGKVIELKEVEREFPPDLINIVYLPVKRGVSIAPPYNENIADQILADYNYARARAILRAIPNTNRAGPYIVSYRAPITGIDRLHSEYLYQDLSAVPPDVVLFWVDAFLRQAAQERYWDEATSEEVALRLRTEIEKVAVAVPDVKTALATWIVWIK